MNSSIVVVGSLNMDQVVHAPRHPEIGETILGNDFHTFFGGKGANQAVAASRCGAQVTMVGRVGADAFGDAILENLKNEGVELTNLRREAQTATGVALIVVDDQGRNTIVVAPGANACVTPQDIHSAQPAFTEASVIVLQLEIPLPAVEEAITIGRRYRKKVVLNAAPARKLPLDTYNQVDYLIINRSELALLSGETSIEAGLKQLINWGGQTILVTLGEHGVLIHEGSSQILLSAYKVKAVDTVGAGDAFVGAFTTAITQGTTTEEAANWGNAAGALAVTRSGAQSSLPYREEIESMRVIYRP